jgi:DNA-binding MarR family transcriptional regulator
MKQIQEPGVGRLIARIHKGIYQYVAARLTNKDLDVGQFFFLRYILHHEGNTQDQIARGILLDKATVSKAVKRLADLGYVNKVANPQDRREWHIFATDKAKNISGELESIFKEVHGKLYQHLDDHQTEQLQSLLQIVYNNFEIQ